MARYVFSDLHGNYQAWQNIKDFLKPSDFCYCLGDCIDRGEDGIKILEEIMRDNRIVLLKGNHEDLLAFYVPYLLDEYYIYLQDWYVNGGEPTWEFLKNTTPEYMLNLVRRINKLPEYLELTNEQGKKIILCHAGTNPNITKEEWMMYGEKQPYLWNRRHILYNWPQDEEYNDTYVIHGHTPVTYDYLQAGMMNYPNLSVSKYADGHKFCLDLATYASNKVALFNLDTFEVTYLGGVK